MNIPLSEIRYLGGTGPLQLPILAIQKSRSVSDVPFDCTRLVLNRRGQHVVVETERLTLIQNMPILRRAIQINHSGSISAPPPTGISLTPSAQGSWSTTPQGPAITITAEVLDFGPQSVESITFYAYLNGSWTLLDTRANIGLGTYSASVLVGSSSDQGQQLDYRFGFANDAGETLTSTSSTTWPTYSPQYFAQGYANIRQANPDSGVYPWKDATSDLTPNGLTDQPIDHVSDWDHGTQIAIARPSYPAVVEANYDNGWPVAFLDFDSGSGQTNNLRFHDGSNPVTWNFGTGDFTAYFVFYYDAINGAALLCNYDGINLGDFSAVGVIGAVFISDSATTTDQLWGANIPDAATSGWRVLAIQRISGTYYAQISDGAGTGSSTDTAASTTGSQAITGAGADDGGYTFGADLRVKAFGFADGAYNGEIPFLFDYLVNTFL